MTKKGNIKSVYDIENQVCQYSQYAVGSLLKEALRCKVGQTRPSPKFSANPINETPIWKWEFKNGVALHYAHGALQSYYKRSKIPFSHDRIQMRQKMALHELGKL